MAFLRSFLRHHFAGKPVVTWQNVGRLLRPKPASKSGFRARDGHMSLAFASWHLTTGIIDTTSVIDGAKMAGRFKRLSYNKMLTVKGCRESQIASWRFFTALWRTSTRKRIIRLYFKTGDEQADVFKSFSEVRMLWCWKTVEWIIWIRLGGCYPRPSLQLLCSSLFIAYAILLHFLFADT